MKSIFNIFLLLSFSLGMAAQNLVENGSFEKHRSCPMGYTQTSLKTPSGWKQAGRGTPDHFAVCSKEMGVPKNMFGHQEAQDGDSYVGLVTFNPALRNYREYLQAELSRPLKAGEKICVEAFFSHADDAQYITDGLGFYFSESPIKSRNNLVLEAEPQLDNPRLHLFDEMENWVQLSDVIVAKGGERYITLGNFKSDNQTNILSVNPAPGQALGGKWAYVFVDAIKVRPVKSEEECACTRDIIESEVVDPPAQLSQNRSIRLSSVLFDFDQAGLSSTAQLELDSLVAIMVNKTDFRIIITGHTDIIGKDGYNAGLSKNRAAAVIEYLKNGGIDKNRLQLEFKGSDEPVADNSSSDGRQQNRRVDFEVIQPAFVRYEVYR